MKTKTVVDDDDDDDNNSNRKKTPRRLSLKVISKSSTYFCIIFVLHYNFSHSV